MKLKLSYGHETLISQFPNIDQVTLRQVLESVKVSHPAIHERWCNAEGQLRENLNIFINGDHIRYRKGLDTAVAEGDEIYIVPLITGG